MIRRRLCRASIVAFAIVVASGGAAWASSIAMAPPPDTIPPLDSARLAQRQASIDSMRFRPDRFLRDLFGREGSMALDAEWVRQVDGGARLLFGVDASLFGIGIGSTIMAAPMTLAIVRHGEEKKTYVSINWFFFGGPFLLGSILGDPFSMVMGLALAIPHMVTNPTLQIPILPHLEGVVAVRTDLFAAESHSEVTMEASIGLRATIAGIRLEARGTLPIVSGAFGEQGPYVGASIGVEL